MKLGFGELTRTFPMLRGNHTTVLVSMVERVEEPVVTDLDQLPESVTLIEISAEES